MGVLQNWDSAEGKLRWQWEHKVTERHPSDESIKGLQPEFPQPYPAMLYRVLTPNPLRFEGHTVNSETEQRNMESRGFVAGGQGAALEAYQGSQQSLAHASANRAFHEQNMSDKAKAEAEKVDLSTLKHVGEIPETPVKRRQKKDPNDPPKKRGRKPKVKPEEPAAEPIESVA